MPKQPKPERGERCGNCRYWKSSDKKPEWGQCRRWPPMGVDAFTYEPEFVGTKASTWCGEWAAADDIPLDQAAKEAIG
jgi:hypothetical protein